MDEAPPAPWRLQRQEILALIQSGQCPAYRSCYHPELEAQARRVHSADYRFLDRALRRGFLESELHSRLSAL